MKRFLLLLTLLSIFLCGKAQTDSIVSSPIDSVAIRTNYLVEEIVTNQLKQNLSERYTIYQTENIYNLLKLDRQTGKIDQIQWSLDSNKEFSVTLNSTNLSYFDGLNSFELYPTKNMYQFILLDKATGRTWHVQWGTESKKRWITRIY